MIDREKVIKGLYAHGYKDCKSCPYWGSGLDGSSECKELAREAWSLLREQEPVTWSYKYNCLICSNCGLGIEDEVHYMMNKPINFCPTCGRKVKWDD